MSTPDYEMPSPEEIHARVLRNLWVLLEIGKTRTIYMPPDLLRQTYKTLYDVGMYMESQGVTQPDE